MKIMHLKDNTSVFLMDREVHIVKLYSDFHLAKVKYLNTQSTFVVDISVLKNTPDITNSISIKMLGGKTI